LLVFTLTQVLRLLRLPCPPLCLQAPRKPLRLSVNIPGTDTPQLLRLTRVDDDDEVVGDIIKAIIAEFKRFKDCDPTELQLYKLDDKGIRGSSEALKPMQTLAEAGLLSATGGGPIKLEVANAAEGMDVSPPPCTPCACLPVWRHLLVLLLLLFASQSF
jgi:hypothetical protein